MWEVFEHVISLKRLTITDVSKATGINQSTFSEWKRRGNDINPKAGKLIARFLGIPLEYLYTGEMPEGYYENDETAAIAQEIHDNRELRGLFSAVKGADPAMIEALHKMFLIMKHAERNERSED